MSRYLLFFAVLCAAPSAYSTLCCSSDAHNYCVGRGFAGCSMTCPAPDFCHSVCSNQPTGIAWLLQPNGETLQIQTRDHYFIAIDDNGHTSLVPYDKRRPEVTRRILRQSEPRSPVEVLTPMELPVYVSLSDTERWDVDIINNDAVPGGVPFKTTSDVSNGINIVVMWPIGANFGIRSGVSRESGMIERSFRFEGTSDTSVQADVDAYHVNLGLYRELYARNRLRTLPFAAVRVSNFRARGGELTSNGRRYEVAPSFLRRETRVALAGGLDQEFELTDRLSFVGSLQYASASGLQVGAGMAFKVRPNIARRLRRVGRGS